MLKFPIYYLEKKEKEKVEHKVSGEGHFPIFQKLQFLVMRWIYIKYGNNPRRIF